LEVIDLSEHNIVLEIPLCEREIRDRLRKIYWKFTEIWDGLLSGYEPFFDEYGNQWDMPYVVKPNNGQVVITFYDEDIPEFIDPEDPQMLDMIYDALTYSILGYLGLDEQQVDVYVPMSHLL